MAVNMKVFLIIFFIDYKYICIDFICMNANKDNQRQIRTGRHILRCNMSLQITNYLENCIYSDLYNSNT